MTILKIFLRIGLAILLTGTVCGQSADELDLSITLVRGERSKDSHSTTRTVRVQVDQATFDLSFTGRRGPHQVPLRRTFTLTTDEVNVIKDLLTQHNWVSEEKGDFSREGAMTYFRISVSLGLGPKVSTILLNGTPDHPGIKSDEKYQYVDLLAREVFRILHAHDPGIEYVAVVE